MPLTANRGEWSELYVLLKLLADQKLFASDSEKNLLIDTYHPVLAVISGKGTSNEIRYSFDDTEIINIHEVSTGDKYQIKRSSVTERLDEIFEQISTLKGSFTIHTATEILDELHLSRIQASSSEKADIFVLIHDRITGTQAEIGLSIKSYIGSLPTLLNASKPTNFKFRIDNFEGDASSINLLELDKENGDRTIQRRINEVIKSGGSFKFVRIHSQIFENNLRMIDSLLPEMVADMLFAWYQGSTGKLSELCEAYDETNIMPITHSAQIIGGSYAYKIQNLLQATALGMKPSKPWNGKYEANGGYLVVKRNGEVLCYHMYDLELFREYLYENTKFEKADTKRHAFGKVVYENGIPFIYLNLQIRFC